MNLYKTLLLLKHRSDCQTECRPSDPTGLGIGGCPKLNQDRGKGRLGAQEEEGGGGDDERSIAILAS